jgi:hypothetical protein
MYGKRIARRMGWCRNSMRRASDHAETVLTALLIVMALVAAPWAGWWAARATYVEDVRAQEWQHRHRFPTDAVIVLVRAEPTADGSAQMSYSPVAQARWTAPDGTPRTGDIDVAADVRAGAEIAIWTDDNGTATLPPGGQNPIAEATVAAVAVVLVLISGLVGMGAIVRDVLDRRRLRSWESEWQVVGPRWSRHR